MQGNTPRHKARDFKTNLAIITLPLLVLWGVFCHFVISTTLELKQDSERLYSNNLPYIKSTFEADYALSKVWYKVELMGRATDVDNLHEQYVQVIDIINGDGLQHNAIMQKEALYLTQSLNKIYELKKDLIERNAQICLSWIRYYSSVDNLYLLTGDFDSTRRLLTSEAGVLTSGMQFMLPAVTRAINEHRKVLHPKCLQLFKIYAADQAANQNPNNSKSAAQSLRLELAYYRDLKHLLVSDANIQDKMLYACNSYETAYGTLQDLMYDEGTLRQRFHSAYLGLLGRIDYLRNQSTDVRFGLTERLANETADGSNFLLYLLYIGGVSVVLSVLWVCLSVWYLFLAPVHKMSELVREFNITYRIPDPREVPLKEMQVILANIRPTLMEVRSIKQKNRYLKELNTKLGQISYIDGLTQLHNRRALEEVIKRRPELNNHSAVFMLDIDHFKLFNDSEGHQAGDEALRMVAKTIKANLTHSKDMVYRYGGEEFCVILTSIDYKSTIELAERIVRAVENLHMRNSGINGYATISLGISYYAGAYAGDMNASIVQHIRWADAALYIAKRQGRNQCRIYKARNDLFFESSPSESKDMQPAPEDEDWSNNQELAGEARDTSLVNNPNGANANADTIALYDAMSDQNELKNCKPVKKGLIKRFFRGKTRDDMPSAFEDLADNDVERLREQEWQEKQLLQANRLVDGDDSQFYSGKALAATLAQAQNQVQPQTLVQPQSQAQAQSNSAKLANLASPAQPGANQRAAHGDVKGAAQGSALTQSAARAGVDNSGTGSGNMVKAKVKSALPHSKLNSSSAQALKAKVAQALEQAAKAHLLHPNINKLKGKSDDTSVSGALGVQAEGNFTALAVNPNNLSTQALPQALSQSAANAPMSSGQGTSSGAAGPQTGMSSGGQAGVHAGMQPRIQAGSQDGSLAHVALAEPGAMTPAGQLSLAGHSGNGSLQIESVPNVTSWGAQGDVQNKGAVELGVQTQGLAQTQALSQAQRNMSPKADNSVVSGEIVVKNGVVMDADHPEALIEAARQENAHMPPEKLAQDKAELSKIQKALPQAYDADDLYSEDYEEDMIIPHAQEIAAQAEKSEQLQGLPKQRPDSDFIHIYYGDTPVPLKDDNEK